MTTIEDILAVIEPGETLMYVELLARLDTPRGMAVVLPDPGKLGSGELVTWREPVWDYDVIGGWTDGILLIRRKPLEAEMVDE